MRKLLLFLFVISFRNTQACICGELGFLTLQECGRYDWIAYGVVNSSEGCPEGAINFHPLKIYKGSFVNEVDISFDCEQECIPDVNAGEHWIFYAKKDNAQELHMSFCSHSRKQVPDSIPDYLGAANGRSFKGEMAFLDENFKVAFKRRGINLEQRKYEKVNPKYIPFLLGSGLLFMVIGYFIFNRIMRNEK
jgi:hypothetical protein